MEVRFTGRARKVMQIANRTFRQQRDDFLNTEHILMAILGEGRGLAAFVLKNRGISFDEIAIKVTHSQGSRSEGDISGKWAATPRAKEAVELAITASRESGQDYVGTEHLLLGLLRQEQAMAGEILRQFITADEFRAELQKIGANRTMEDLEQEQHVLHLIRSAFAGVVLGSGVGLRQGQGLDDYADARTLASYRAQDEKRDWTAIPAKDLDRYSSSLCFFDPEGMRFHLPAYLVADLEETLELADPIFHLTYMVDGALSSFDLLSPAQRHAVRGFLLLRLSDPHLEFVHPMIEDALRDYWTAER